MRSHRSCLRQKHLNDRGRIMDDPKATSLCAVHTVPGVIPHWTRPGQTVVWNMAGQVAFAESSNITILVSGICTEKRLCND